MNRLILVGCMIFYAAGIQAENSIQRPDRPHFTDREALDIYRSVLFDEYLLCSENATKQILSRNEVEACSDLYLAIKLSFLDGVTMDRYFDMPPKTKAVANDKGYASFRAWVHRLVTSQTE